MRIRRQTRHDAVAKRAADAVAEIWKVYVIVCKCVLDVSVKLMQLCHTTNQQTAYRCPRHALSIGQGGAKSCSVGNNV